MVASVYNRFLALEEKNIHPGVVIRYGRASYRVRQINTAATLNLGNLHSFSPQRLGKSSEILKLPSNINDNTLEAALVRLSSDTELIPPLYRRFLPDEGPVRQQLIDRATVLAAEAGNGYLDFGGTVDAETVMISTLREWVTRHQFYDRLVGQPKGKWMTIPSRAVIVDLDTTPRANPYERFRYLLAESIRPGVTVRHRFRDDALGVVWTVTETGRLTFQTASWLSPYSLDSDEPYFYERVDAPSEAEALPSAPTINTVEAINLWGDVLLSPTSSSARKETALRMLQEIVAQVPRTSIIRKLAEEILQIEKFRLSLAKELGSEVSEEEAAGEWIKENASRFATLFGSK